MAKLETEKRALKGLLNDKKEDIKLEKPIPEKMQNLTVTITESEHLLLKKYAVEHRMKMREVISMLIKELT